MLTWDEAQDAFPSGHLVSGFYDLDRLNRLKQIEQLIRTMQPKGRYACRSVIEKGERKMEILFEDERDAAKLGDTLRARQGTGVPGYGSHRWFEYSPIMFRVLTETLKG